MEIEGYKVLVQRLGQNHFQNMFRVEIITQDKIRFVQAITAPFHVSFGEREAYDLFKAQGKTFIIELDNVSIKQENIDTSSITCENT